MEIKNKLVERIKIYITYHNILLEKSKIFKDNKGKSGIYRWVNKINNDTYIGSSVDLTSRLRKYFSIKGLENKLLNDNSRIYRALLQYNYSNFKLEILEYCDKELVLVREQYYLDLLQPEYNILKIAGSSLGFKHSTKTLLKFLDRDLKTGSKTTILNVNNQEVLEFNSIRKAAKNLCISNTTLLDYIYSKKLLKNTYLIKVVHNKDIVETNVASKDEQSTVKLLNSSNNLIQEFNNKKSVAKYLSAEYNVIISVTTISSYIKSGKLYKNQYIIYI
uniref:GIY-YIG domain-containing protein n=1 Tax=Beauveria caledonica TaxID=38006 RepID=A0A190XD55_9HYPO|nr:hypothetical protein [Beauveria caledonica]AMD61824.1 hypothetical protein [Beauveria caledonica]